MSSSRKAACSPIWSSAKLPDPSPWQIVDHVQANAGVVIVANANANIDDGSASRMADVCGSIPEIDDNGQPIRPDDAQVPASLWAEACMGN